MYKIYSIHYTVYSVYCTVQYMLDMLFSGSFFCLEQLPLRVYFMDSEYLP